MATHRRTVSLKQCTDRPPFTEAPIFETERLVFRGHRVDDFENCAALWADPEVVRFISGTPFTAEASWARLLRYIGHWPAVGYGYWVAEAKDDGRFVGEVGFADYKRDITPSLAGKPEAGWVLTTAEHGKGLATEAVKGITSWADRFLTHGETVCIFDPEHQASIHVGQKAGYSGDTIATYHDRPTLIMSRTAVR